MESNLYSLNLFTICNKLYSIATSSKNNRQIPHKALAEVIKSKSNDEDIPMRRDETCGMTHNLFMALQKKQK